MKRWLAAAAFLAVGMARAGDLPEPVADALRQAGISEDAVGIYVQDTAGGPPLLALNADQALNPASVMKLVTTYAGLELLGPAFTWKTRVLRNGSLEGDILQGDLVIKGGGDPKLTQEDFWLLLRRLRQAGIRHIRGDVVVDGAYYDVPEGDPGAFDGEPYKAYNVAPQALTVNFQVVWFRLHPNGEGVQVTADPSPERLAVVNRLKLADGAGCGNWQAKVSREGETPTVTFDGKLDPDCGEQTTSLNLMPNLAYLDTLFRQMWKEAGGTLRGVVRSGTTPASAVPLLATASESLTETVRDINKFSNNTMARALFLTLGAESLGPPATPLKSADAVRCWLAAKELDFPELVLENGSGLSRLERISARHLGELLVAAYRSPVMPEFLASLPVAALDGTMKRRLNEGYAARMARVKTGTLDGTKSVAGYVRDAQGRWLAVAFLVNHPRAAQAGKAQDALLEWLHYH